MRYCRLLALGLLLGLPVAARAQNVATFYTLPQPMIPMGYQQITAVSASTGLTVPAGATAALISVEGAAVRYRDDGVAPTATVGMPLGIGAQLSYSTSAPSATSLASLRFIQQAAGAILNVSYYR